MNMQFFILNKYNMKNKCFIKNSNDGLSEKGNQISFNN
ncbi:hypothetical protein bcere0024_054810 [Bacillus cereus Rock4-18]|nr:hypothetical protein bcere0024_054810 [Bacillus cereus Rock4-18]